MKTFKGQISVGEKIILAALLCCLALGLALGKHRTGKVAAIVNDVHSGLIVNHAGITDMMNNLSAMKKELEDYEAACNGGNALHLASQRNFSGMSKLNYRAQGDGYDKCGPR